MGFAHDSVVAVGQALASVHAGEDKLAHRKLHAPGVLPLEVWSPVFTAGGALPSSAVGETPPPIAWREVPPNTKSIVVVVEDPDAPLPKPFVHWLVYGIPADVRELDLASSSRFRQGRNSNLRNGFSACAPPPGHGIHHYHFQVFALDVHSDLPPGDGRHAVLELMAGHVVAYGEIVATNQRT